MHKNVPSVGLRWWVVIFPSVTLCETILDCPFLRSQGCWQWSPSGRAGGVEKQCWQPCHTRTCRERLGIYSNAAAAAPRSWCRLCLTIRILRFLFLMLQKTYPNSVCYIMSICISLKCFNSAHVLLGCRDWSGLPQSLLRNASRGLT